MTAKQQIDRLELKKCVVYHNKAQKHVKSPPFKLFPHKPIYPWGGTSNRMLLSNKVLIRGLLASHPIPVLASLCGTREKSQPSVPCLLIRATQSKNTGYTIQEYGIHNPRIRDTQSKNTGYTIQEYGSHNNTVYTRIRPTQFKMKVSVRYNAKIRAQCSVNYPSLKKYQFTSFEETN